MPGAAATSSPTHLAALGIQTKKYFRPLHPMPAYRAFPDAGRTISRTREAVAAVDPLPADVQRARRLRRRPGERGRSSSSMGADDRSAPLRLALGRAALAPAVRTRRSRSSASLIPTWNRAELLTTRTLPSVLRQTYPHWEVVVVGDACTDDTARADCRARGSPHPLRATSQQRGVYPEDPLQRWMVAGCGPPNTRPRAGAGRVARLTSTTTTSSRRITRGPAAPSRGTTAGRVRVRRRATSSARPTEWLRIGKLPPQPGNVMHSAVLYRSYLRFLKYDLEAWKDSVGADAHLWGRM